VAIEVVRIDDRLIHGQIVQGWLKVIEVNKILLISDEVAGDKMQQILLSMAMPSNVQLVIKNIKDASYELSNDVYDKDKLMILFSNPQDIVKMLDNGVKFKSINVGGMHFSHGKTQILKNLSVDKQDVISFLKLIENNIELESRILPADERHNIMEDINNQAKVFKIIE
jgi:PTS system mannose-specific IIB component